MASVMQWTAGSPVLDDIEAISTAMNHTMVLADAPQKSETCRMKLYNKAMEEVQSCMTALP